MTITDRAPILLRVAADLDREGDDLATLAKEKRAQAARTVLRLLIEAETDAEVRVPLGDGAGPLLVSHCDGFAAPQEVRDAAFLLNVTTMDLPATVAVVQWDGDAADLIVQRAAFLDRYTPTGADKLAD